MERSNFLSTVLTWTGRGITALIVLLFCFGGVVSILKPASMQQQMEEGSQKMGWSPADGTTLGVVELACAVLYAIPQTAVLGSILLTGYLGGAVATHARIHDPMMAVPIVFGVLVWLGIFLREPRLRAILPWR